MRRTFDEPGAAAAASSRSQERPDNLLLRALDEGDYRLLTPYLRPVELHKGSVIAAQHDRIVSVCFPEFGVTSIADVSPDGARTEVALVGRDGMTNSQLLLGCDEAPHEAIVQIGQGRSMQLPADILQCFCRERPAAAALFLRFVHALSVQTARTLASNLRDPVEKRLARWLLMCHDRLDGDEIQLLHDQLARMLAVRRATVTDTLHVLEERRAIRSERGRITVRQRSVLEQIAGASYGSAEQHYSRHVAPFGRSQPGPAQPHLAA